MKLEDIFVYMVLMIVSFIAGLVGIVTKNKLSKALNLKGKFTLFLKGMLGSMFVAYL
ncbi:hypothetical protein OEC98_000375, partial [Campylobacter jejuni]|nr:hypothetical protein [Campylobacter jejuni]EJX6020416.1 hypothetical protein [Campylobacter jejuni]EKE4886174.1 hypothetical protein [Campylobacter jejuni]EKQ0947270.1 hypothetical protein [Campylobacter jejuni]